jgi:hypothetical protein
MEDMNGVHVNELVAYDLFVKYVHARFYLFIALQ